MAQPNLPSYGCKSQEWADSDPNTQEAWLGPAFTSNTSYSTAVTEAPILNRVVGQRLCLEVFGQNEHTSPVCEVQRKVFEEFFHEPQPPCLPEKFIFSETAGSALLIQAPAAAVPPPTKTVPTTTPPATKTLRCPKDKRKTLKRGKQICVKKKRHEKAKTKGLRLVEVLFLSSQPATFGAIAAVAIRVPALQRRLGVDRPAVDVDLEVEVTADRDCVAGLPHRADSLSGPDAVALLD